MIDRQIIDSKVLLAVLLIVLVGVTSCIAIQVDKLTITTTESRQLGSLQAASVAAEVPITNSASFTDSTVNRLATPTLSDDISLPSSVFGKGQGLVLIGVKDDSYDYYVSNVWYYQDYFSLQQDFQEVIGTNSETLRIEAMLISTNEASSTVFLSGLSHPALGEAIIGWEEFPLIELKALTSSPWPWYPKPLGSIPVGKVDHLWIERQFAISSALLCSTISDLDDLNQCAIKNKIDIQSYDWTRSTGRLLVSKLIDNEEEREYELIMIGNYGFDLLSCSNTVFIKDTLISNCGSTVNLADKPAQTPAGGEACPLGQHWSWWYRRCVTTN